MFQGPGKTGHHWVEIETQKQEGLAWRPRRQKQHRVSLEANCRFTIRLRASAGPAPVDQNGGIC